MWSKIINVLKTNIVVRNVVLAFSLIMIAAISVYMLLGVITRHGQRYTLPDFSAMSIEQAKEVSGDMGLVFEVTDSLYIPKRAKGSIIEQYPKAGNFVKKGRRIFLTTNSYNPKMVPVPYVAGFSLRQAKNKIIGAGFEIERITYKQDLATFNVLKQYYKGKEIKSNNSNVLGESGSGTTLIVGLNPVDPPVLIPNLSGLTVGEAKNRLWESGFNVGNIDFDSNVADSDENSARVYSQTPLPARVAMHGRTISFKASVDDKKIDKAVNDISKDVQKYVEQQKALEQELSTSEDTSGFEDMIKMMNKEIE